MNGGELVSVLEAFYALDVPDPEWLSGSLSALSRVAGRGHDYTAFFYDASDTEKPRVGTPRRLEPLPPELVSVWSVFQSTLSPAFARATFRSLFVGSAKKTALGPLGPVLAERERHGHGDMFYLNALDPSGIGCALLFSARTQDFSIGPKDRALLKRMAHHLSAATRCRRRLRGELGGFDSAESGKAVAEAIVDDHGRIVHAEGVAKEESARDQILAAAAAIDAARTRAHRSDGDFAMESWHPLTSARWTLVDSFESDGRRFVVARENQAGAPDLGLTDRERQVVVHAALGQTNKEIAYMLGISDSTVRVLVARAARRLGARGRRDLLKHPVLQALATKSQPP
ncbi:MAG TPA: LuxR C-terminal-related transcriptional regulator [Polyangiaceae bacterium]|nr:LuxR C-terminal-related transcriptional regulator [Polyangiaceae bacterium]